MSFTICVEHELIDGTVVTEEIEDVVAFQNPPCHDKTHFELDDGSTVEITGRRLVGGNEQDATSDSDAE